MRTRQVRRMPRPQKTQAAANSDSENGKPAARGKEAQQDDLDHGRNGECAEGECELRATRRPREPDTREDHREQHERHRARGEHEHREEREPTAPPGLERPEGEKRQRHAEREREGARQNDSCPDDGEGSVRPACSRAPFARCDDPEREGGGGDARDGE